MEPSPTCPPCKELAGPPRRRPCLLPAPSRWGPGRLSLFAFCSVRLPQSKQRGPGEADLAELKQVVAEHDEAAGKLLQTNQKDEALAGLTQALAAIDRGRVGKANATGCGWESIANGPRCSRAGPGSRGAGRRRKARPLLEEQYAAQPDNVELAGAWPSRRGPSRGLRPCRG